MLARLKSAINGPKPSRGRDRRGLPRLEELRATLVLNDVSHGLVDWNPKGFQIEEYIGPLRADETARLRLIIPHRGKTHGFDLEGEVKRYDPANRALGGVFINVSSQTQRKLKKLFADKMEE